MKASKRELADALRERLRIIGDENSRHDPERHIQRLRVISERIDQLSQDLSLTIDPRLAHFLERKSYNKALELLDGAASLAAQNGPASTRHPSRD